MSTNLHAVTVFGHDRPGIIAETTAGLARLGLNIEDSTMTLLRGHFAMMLLCAGDVSSDEIQGALSDLTRDSELDVSVRPVSDQPVAGGAGTDWLLTVHGGDRPGIVSEVVARVATAGGNITDLTTRLAGDLYLLTAEIRLPATADATLVESEVRAAAARLGVTATWRPAEADEL